MAGKSDPRTGKDRRVAPASKATSVNPKDILGQKKVALAKVPRIAIHHLAHAMMNGATKYGAYNWRSKDVLATIYVEAAQRHLDYWLEGEENAKDSGVHHLGHAMACCAILLDAMAGGNMVDDRPVIPGNMGYLDAIERLREKVEAAAVAQK